MNNLNKQLLKKQKQKTIKRISLLKLGTYKVRNEIETKHRFEILITANETQCFYFNSSPFNRLDVALMVPKFKRNHQVKRTDSH